MSSHFPPRGQKRSQGEQGAVEAGRAEPAEAHPRPAEPEEERGRGRRREAVHARATGGSEQFQGPPDGDGGLGINLLSDKYGVDRYN